MECRSADVTVGGIVRGQVVSVHLRSTPRRPSAWVFRSGGANPPGLAGLTVGMGGACPLHLTSHPVTSARAMRANITTPKHHPPGAEPRARDGAPWVETRLPGLESRSSPAISAIPMRTGPHNHPLHTQKPGTQQRSRAYRGPRPGRARAESRPERHCSLSAPHSAYCRAGLGT